MTSKYTAITNELELLLRRMRAEGKNKLPSEQELAAGYSCSRQTVRTALDVLVERGLIVKKNGSGSYLADDVSCNKQIYFITEDADRYRTPALIAGLRDELDAAGYKLKVFATGGCTGSEREVLDLALKEHPVAMITEPVHDLLPDPNQRLIEKNIASGIPVIYLNSSHVPSGCLYVAPENVSSGRMLTNCLIKEGHRRIACIFRMDSSSGTDGYQGYIDALADAGMRFDESRCLLLSYRDEKEILSGKCRLLQQFIVSSLKDCDAVICQNGIIAYTLSGLLAKEGMSAPDDITVACFDGSYPYDLSARMISLEYDNDLLCRKLANTAVTLARGGAASDVVIPMGFALSQSVEF
ncbi:MAG: substrate-binding domain-containing protein [Saccharofermentans sp.]|nr:substrate-binding domain-containing protein [Saccharofermentans sp.]